MIDQELIEQPHLLHEDGPCDVWDRNYTSGGVWELTYQYGIVSLNFGSVIHGDWDDDETPNCPECGSNLLVEWGTQIFDPWDWFRATAVTT